MNILDQLAMGLGFATLAGLNLYLTVLIVGLAVRFHWLELSAEFNQLEVLGSMPVLAVAGVLFALEFFADKIGWVDTLWDTVHTVIRPVGGGLLALAALGQVEPELQVIIALVAGGATLVSHGAKASTRVAINHSPEPVSNVAMSLAEDAVVIGGTVAALAYPRVTAAVCVVFLAVSLWVLPKAFRHFRATWWLIWKRLAPAPSDGNGGREPLGIGELPVETVRSLRAHLGVAGDANLVLHWAVPALTGGGKRLRGWSRNVRGWLVNREDREVYFAGRRLFRPFIRRIDLQGASYHREKGPLSESISLVWEDKGAEALFRVSRSDSPALDRIATWLETRGVRRQVETPALQRAPAAV
ncbi:MAG TPA: DUF4126 domain-containing protein [Verrucomicrobiales bacterium]|nr:DUF4126 domain-containing protein [Verrucomicrobiales bacterium]